MKKLLVIIAGLVLSVNGAFATRYVTTTAYPKTPAYNPSVYNNGYRNINSDKIAQVEQSVYGRTYEGQSFDNRLKRLEKSLFNRTYSNLPYEERINNLVVNYNNNYNNYNTNYTAPVANSRGGGLLNLLGTMLMGTPTGLSPQINPYWTSNPSAPNGRQTDYYGRNGWSHHNEQIGSGMGVHIID